MRSIVNAAILLFATIVSGCASTLWIRKDFDSTRTHIDTVAVILPRVEYFEKVGQLRIAEVDTGTVVSHTVAAAIKQIIDEGNFIPRSAILIHSQTQDSLRISPDHKMTCPLTNELRSLVDKAHAKYFMYVRGTAFTTPEKSKQDDLLQIASFHLFFDKPLSYDSQWSGLKLEIALVEAISTQVLWYNRNEDKDSNYDPLDKARVRDLCLKLLSAR